MKERFWKWFDGDLDVMEHILDHAEVPDAPRETLKKQEQQLDRELDELPHA